MGQMTLHSISGYIHHFPFMSEDILLKTENSFCPENLYQQCVLLKNPKVFYMGMANQALSMTVFQHQSFYIRGMTHINDSLLDAFTFRSDKWKTYTAIAGRDASSL